MWVFGKIAAASGLAMRRKIYLCPNDWRSICRDARSPRSEAFTSRLKAALDEEYLLKALIS
jgi:hypothetical protein